MKIKHTDDGQNGMFYIEMQGIIEAELAYVWAGTASILINHTVVGTALKGQGAGKQLVHSAVEFARSKTLTIVPLCPFARSVFDKITAYGDVLA